MAGHGPAHGPSHAPAKKAASHGGGWHHAPKAHAHKASSPSSPHSMGTLGLWVAAAVLALILL